MRRRAVGLRGFVYFVGTHTRSTVPLGRSAAALGAIIEGPQILLLSDSNRKGKGLIRSCAHVFALNSDKLLLISDVVLVVVC